MRVLEGTTARIEPEHELVLTDNQETVSSYAEANHAKVDQFEQLLLQNPDTLIDLPLVHRFTPGLYIREIFNPAGSVIVTKVHKIEHPFMLCSGRLLTFDAESGKSTELVAPHLGITEAGTRRVIAALEDSIFVTFHPNPDDCTDLDILEQRLIVPRGDTFNQFKAILEQRKEENPVASIIGCQVCGSTDLRIQEWWCDDQMWLHVIGQLQGVVCAPCFDNLARKKGWFLTWEPKQYPGTLSPLDEEGTEFSPLSHGEFLQQYGRSLAAKVAQAEERIIQLERERNAALSEASRLRSQKESV